MTRRRVAAVGAGLACLGLLLAVPEPSPSSPPLAEASAFEWDRAALFDRLEAEFRDARALGLDAVAPEVDRLEADGRSLVDAVTASGDSVPFEALGQLETVQFALAARAAAHGALLPRVHGFVRDARLAVMRAARVWPTGDVDSRAAVYRVIYGGRAALEEALVQTGSGTIPALTLLEEAPAPTPSVEVAGVRVHSGDILLSRGGAPTSALIARGNDYPGVFSHAALVHVDEATGEATVIEALIETGTHLTTPGQYLADTKLRILVLRPRVEALGLDPRAPHDAASAMLARLRAGHVEYDFAMHWDSPAALFCSEVPFHAYRELGADLWAVRSPMSAPGLRRWLGAMGVEEFTTLVPSDLEYDPRLAAVAEWRDLDTLQQHRVDNAILDALLEAADRGAELGYPWYLLPAARVVKGWSVVTAALGRQPTIPTGMSAAAALRVDALVSRVHPVLAAEVEAGGRAFRAERGYEAPYWVLVDLARAALGRHRAGLAPALRSPVSGR